MNTVITHSLERLSHGCEPLIVAPASRRHFLLREMNLLNVLHSHCQSALIIALCLLCFSCGTFSNERNREIRSSQLQYKTLDHNRSTVVPQNGFVPDEATAVAIAVAVWSPIYGKYTIKSEKPYRATLRDGVWTVKGSVPKLFLFPRMCVFGGTAVAEISQKDGHIISVVHTK